MKTSIPVTKPFLPPLDEVVELLGAVWESGQLTNGGPQHSRLEGELAKRLGLTNLSLCNNGTLALILALQSQQVAGEVITTPYSFAATRNVLDYVGCSAKYVDIEPDTWNIDPALVEREISSKTRAILAVHCYGNPCNHEVLKSIAAKWGIPVVYDAAHAFGVRENGKSILGYGNASAVSFHATKVFNTFEGGMVVVESEDKKNEVDRLKNFGLDANSDFIGPGLNGKMSELNAVIGLCQLNYIESLIAQRKSIDNNYREKLSDIDGVTLYQYPDNVESNYSYFPILINNEYPISRDLLIDKLKTEGILARKYFYPILSDSAAKQKDLDVRFPIATAVANQVICLPIFPGLREDQIDKICKVIENH